MTRARRARAACAVVLAAAVLGGCGSESSGSPSYTATTSTATASTATAPTATSSVTASISTPLGSTAANAPAGTTVASGADATAPAGQPSTDPPSATAAPTPAARPTSATPPDPAQLSFIEIGEMSQPLDMTYRAGDDAFYLVSKAGSIVAMRAGVIDHTPVLDISADVSTASEQGLLGLAFSTDGHHAYVDYTDGNGDTEIVEYAVGPDGVFDPSSKRSLLHIDQPFANHNGGQVRIGPDGLLYIGMGDGGDSGDPQRNGLNADALLGKLLRIDPTPSADLPYTIPADNPFVGLPGARPEIWSVGLRNPWRYSFDLATNDLWIADVGQGEWEEIDVAYAADGGGRGTNFGWSAFEGSHRYNDDQPADGVTAPIHEYEHGDAGCSVSGGVRYRGSAIASLYGWYVYGDYCSGQIRAFAVLDDGTAGDEVVLSSDMSDVSEVAQGPDGELYVLRVDSGRIFALRPAG